MNKFDERKKNFEKKFQIDEELKFKVEARRNKYLGEWASSLLGKTDEDKQKYIQEIIKVDMQEAKNKKIINKIKLFFKIFFCT